MLHVFLPLFSFIVCLQFPGKIYYPAIYIPQCLKGSEESPGKISDLCPYNVDSDIYQSSRDMASSAVKIRSGLATSK